jgi:branched-chain amino acid transport system substrate-binding protein
MSDRWWTWRTFAALAAVTLAATTACASSAASPSNDGGAQPNTAALGAPNKATGAPIKIGFVHDGKSVGIDHTPIIGAFKATVQYANDYLGGINGHVIEVDDCSTDSTPAGATSCGHKLVDDKVAAVLVPVSAQDTVAFAAIAESGIPYVTYAAASADIALKAGSFVLVNPVGLIAATAKIARDDNVRKAGMIVIDVPAASGPVAMLAPPVYKKAGAELDLVKISPETTDMTPQLREAIAGGAEQFAIAGTDEFNTAVIKTLKDLGYPGKIIMLTAPTKAIVDGVPGGLYGVMYITAMTNDPHEKDVQIYNAVMATYMKDIKPTTQSGWAFANVLAFVRGLTGQPTAVDAPTVSQALSTMPAPAALPMGGGITFQCGAKLVALTPNACSSNVLTTALDAQGNDSTYSLTDVTPYMTLG